MINIGRHPCNYDRLDFSEHETSDVEHGGRVVEMVVEGGVVACLAEWRDQTD